MAATFPNGIASFTTKRDSLDVNYAADINRLQDEIVAMQVALGALVTQFTEVQEDIDDLEESQREDDYIEKQNLIKFKNLGDRLNYIQNGKHIRAFELTRNNLVLSRVKNGNTRPNAIAMTRPTATRDPWKMYNGRGVTLPVSGFWIFSGIAHFDVGDNRAAGGGATDNTGPNVGEYNGAIMTANDWADGADKYWWRGGNPADGNGAHENNIFLTMTKMGWYGRGTKIDLGVSHTAKSRQRVNRTKLAGFMLRTAGQ